MKVQLMIRHNHEHVHTGLSKRWCSTNKGLIYCTTPTAKLASDRLKVRKELESEVHCRMMTCQCAISAVWTRMLSAAAGCAHQHHFDTL